MNRIFNPKAQLIESDYIILLDIFYERISKQEYYKWTCRIFNSFRMAGFLSFKENITRTVDVIVSSVW